MEGTEQAQQKFGWKAIGLAIVLIVLLGVVFGTRWAGSYYREQGAKYLAQGNFAAAKASFNRSLFFGSRNPLTHAYLGRVALGPQAPGQEVYYPQANYPEAVGHHEAALSLGLEAISPVFYRQALEDLGFAYWNLKQHRKANEKYLEQIAKYPNSSFWARYFVGLNYFDRFNKPAEALDILSAAPASQNVAPPFLHRIYALLARLYSYAGDSENAIRYARLAIDAPEKMNAKDLHVQIAHLVLAQRYAEEGNLKAAEAEIAIANDLSGSSTAHQCVLARVYQTVGRYSQAITVAKQADPAQPAYPYSICLATLGRSFAAREETTEAKRYFEQYLALTAAMAEKNIFVVRDRGRIQEELQKLQ